MSKDKKTHSLAEVDALTMKAEAQGVLIGMVESHRLFYDATTDVKLGLETLQGLYEIGNDLGKRTKDIHDLQFALDALTYLQIKFQDYYDGRMNSYREEYGEDKF